MARRRMTKMKKRSTNMKRGKMKTPSLQVSQLELTE
jgi:hypothetical protein